MSRGEPITPLSNFDQAIEDGRLDAAWRNALLVGHLTLDRALRLTILMAAEGSPGYERAGRRFLIRLMNEYEPELEVVRMAAEALEHLSHSSLAIDARIELSALAEKLAQQNIEGWRGGGGGF